MDNPSRRRIYVVEQCGDKTRRRLSAYLGGPGKYRGGWEVSDGGNLRLKLIKGNKLRTLASIFFQPNLPTIDDYYEPFTYDYQNLFNAPAGITGR